MIQTGFEQRVNIQQVIDSQLPEFLLDESPKSAEFLKQYYLSQEFQSGPTDLAVNLDQYLKLNNYSQEVIQGETTLYAGISTNTDTIEVYSTKGFPNQYGLFKIDDEIITYTGLTTNTFTGCKRGFSGITSYRTDLESEELVFSSTSEQTHASQAKVTNLSALFLKEFYRKLKYTYTPGLEDVEFVKDLDVNNFIKESRSLYESKGTEESFRILFNVLYGVEPQIIDLEQYLPKPSTAEFLRREIVVAERVGNTGDPTKLVGQTITKSTDSATKASVSEVEPFTRSGISTYYKMGLFVGFSDRALIEGTFNIQAKSKVVNPVSAGSSVITVDSTIGFGATGTLISDSNVITYSDKSINQFLGCKNIVYPIGISSDVRTNEVFFGYEDGDTSKKVEFRLTGVLSEFEATSDITSTTEGQYLYVKNVGEKIKNPEQNKTFKQIFANSWIYNTSSRFDITNINQSTRTLTLSAEIDPSSLKKGDTVDILKKSTQNIAFSGAIIDIITPGTKQIELRDLLGFTVDPNETYTIRRRIKTATSTGTPLSYGQNQLTVDIQNVYNENDENFYIGSNSLPAGNITKNTIKETISTTTLNSLQGYDPATQQYYIISFPVTSVDFVTGDRIYYNPETTQLKGLDEGYYYVKVLDAPNNNQIKLYQSRSLIELDGTLDPKTGSPMNTAMGFVGDGSNNHSFILAHQKSDKIFPQKLLKKFPSKQNLQKGEVTKTIPGSTGMLVNGVEVINYKSVDKVYYGPLEKVVVYGQGKDYDVVNPPKVTVATGVGITALIQPVIGEGVIKDVLVDPHEFDIENVDSVSISGGNGSGAELSPVMGLRYREVEFDVRELSNGGGIDVTQDTITFLTDHGFSNGQPLVYNSRGNEAVGISSVYGYSANNADVDIKLQSNAIYYAQWVNNKTIKLFHTTGDQQAGINTVGLTTSHAQGIHKFRTAKATNVLRSVKVLNGGSGYTNRELKVTPAGISTVSNTINFKNHGFNDGDKIVYNTGGTSIEGLTVETGITSTSQHYQVLKIDDNSFRLADSGIGGTITSNYTRKNNVNLVSIGSSHHNFKYPNIEVSIATGISTVATGVITATPVVRGKITDAYLYEAGTGYGSTIINFHKKPIISIKSGKGAEFKPVIVDGKVSQVLVSVSGSGYTSPPDLTLVGIGSGIGAKFRPVVQNGEVSHVIVINEGRNYDVNTSIASTAIGLNGFIEPYVRELTWNNGSRFGDEILVENVDGLEYGWVGYSTALGQKEYGDNLRNHSPIIGWAYDGNPIYGPVGYSDPEDDSSSRIMLSGYSLIPSNITDRPSFSNGSFVEDYEYTNAGDLDKHNGRYCKTPEFPNGTYAYFASVDFTTLVSTFPYFIGDTYRSVGIGQTVDQNFNFNNSDLVRNTFPYKVNDLFANNDFIVEPYEITQQRAVVDSVVKGSIENIIVNESGDGYIVGDTARFDNTGTNGGGLSAFVSKLKGKTIVDINTEVEDYQTTTLIWDNSNQVSVHIDPVHALVDEDNVVISGVSTYIAGLTQSHVIGVTSERTFLLAPVPSNSTVGYVTDIYVSSIPDSVSVGSTFSIKSERVSVLDTFEKNKVIRIVRGESVGAAYTASTELNTVPSSFTIPLETPLFESKLNDVRYFNPLHSVGIGTTTGGTTTKNYRIGEADIPVSIANQSIYIPNHPFKQNQKLTFKKYNSSSQNIGISTEPDSSILSLPELGVIQTVYVINKSKDFIGLTTQIGLTTSTNGLYFRSFTSNADDRDYRYSLTSNYTQETAKAEKITATVAVSTSHGMLNNDVIDLSVRSNQSVGIGTSTAVRVKYHSGSDKLIVNPTTFAHTALNASKNELTLTDHGFKTGDKVFYDSTTSQPLVGLGTGGYYTYRVDDNKFQLSHTRYDTEQNPPIIISLDTPSAGSTHQISKINPQINVINNNNLVFDVSDTTLSGYDFKIYYDKEFNNELVSVGGTVTDFVISDFGGAVGCGTTSTLTLNYTNQLPTKLYYNLERTGYISTSDTNVKNSSEIIFGNSVYDNTFAISGVAATSFKFSLNSLPETLQYTQSNTDILEYSTSSTTANGGVDAMRITSGGLNYKKLPSFKSINSTNGQNADIIPASTSIGRIKQVTVENAGFEYSADKTLRPEAYVSPDIVVINRNTITNIEVITGGTGYTNTPNLVVVNPDTGLKYDSGIFKAEIQGSSIDNVEIVQAPKGLSDVTNIIYSLNNTNGSGIETCMSSTSGILTCFITTPIAGFATPPFAVGDKVFVEGIVNIGFNTTGTGFNSEDYGFKFFNVSAYDPSVNPVKVEVDLSEFVTNAGLAVTNQNGYASLINQNNYPTFKLTQEPLDFIEGETLLTAVGTAQSITSYIERDIVITHTLSDGIKVFGTYDLEKDQIILGKRSGTLATIKSTNDNEAYYRVDYSLRQDRGWSDDIGKLNVDYQVLPDNDYYQNLSYTIKSPIEWEDLVNPVNRLLHSSGLKNFADTGITTTTNVTAGTSLDSDSITIIDIIGEKRVDTISDFDFAIDIDTLSNNKSRFIKLKTKRLSDYIDCNTNRVLAIDDISGSFSRSDKVSDLFSDLLTYSVSEGYNRFLVQVVNPNNKERQATDVITLTNSYGGQYGQVYTIEKGSIGIGTAGTRVGDIGGNIDSEGILTLRFDPIDPYTHDYDIKVIRTSFNSSLAGIGTTKFGFIDIDSRNQIVASNTTVGIITANIDENEGFYANVEIINATTDDTTYVEMFVDQDGTNSYISDFWVDNRGSNSKFIGAFTSNISSGVLSIDYENDEANSVLVRSRIVGFGTTSVGIGTYRFLSTGQSPETEKTARYEAKYALTAASPSVTNVFSLDKTDATTIKTIAKVGYGLTSALHQILSIGDETDIYTTQYPFLSIGSTSGIGTFGSEYSGSNAILKFYPDAGVSQEITIQTYSEVIQTDRDLLNVPNDLSYGPVNERYLLGTYDGQNRNRLNKDEFVIRHEGVPIYAKTFDPATTVNLSTGLFTINDHFLNTGEKLEYRSTSTFSNITASDMVMSNGSVLPADLYAIKVSDNTFNVATTKANAVAGTNVTFNTAGAGNAHKIGMVKKAEKTVLSLDGVVQSPLTWTPINHTLANNGGSIGVGDTYFALSGISSIVSNDVLKIGNEYIKVVNVGLGTLAVGPITADGTFNVIEAERGFVGTTAATHNDGAEARVYLGAFNLIDSTIYFTQPPIGNNAKPIDPDTNLKTPRSTFGGRVFMRQDYDTNQIYDNISKSFTGIGATYTLSVNGINTTGIETGSGIVFINNIFQTPSTVNNTGNNYSFSEDSNVGVSSIKFTGITDDSGNILLSDEDVNKNQLPRGGVIVSLGSTLGVGYAPPVGAAVSAVLNSSGGITAVGIGTTDNNGSGYRGVVGVGVTDEAYVHKFVSAATGAVTGTGGPFTPTNAVYESHTGILTLTIPSHGRSSGNVQLVNNSLVFTCSRDGHASEHTYPRATDPAANGNNLALTKIDNDTISINVGAGGGKGTGATVTATVGAGGTIIFGVSAAGSNYVNPKFVVSPPPSYENLPVVGVSRRGLGATTETGKGLLVTLDVGPASPTPQDNKFGDAADLIDKNRLLISETAARRMKERFPSYNYPSGFVEQDCIDDVIDVLEAVSYNMRYGGNDKTYDASRFYIDGFYSNPAPVTGEEEQVVYAMMEARDMASLALANKPLGRFEGAQYAHTYSGGTATNAVVSGGDYDHTFVSAVTNGINGSLTPNGATYIAGTGVLTLTFASAHGVADGGNVTIADYSLVFTCDRDNNQTNHAYPRSDDPASGSTLSATLISPTSFSVNVGTSPLVFKNVVTGSNPEKTSYDPLTGDLVLNVGSGHGFLAPTTLATPTAALYAPTTGVLRLTIPGHGLAVGDYIKIVDDSLTFTCARDNHSTEHKYPRFGDPASGEWINVNQRSANRIWVNIGKSPDISAHTFVSARQGVSKANSNIGIGTQLLGFKCTRDATSANPEGVSQVLYPRSTDRFCWNKNQISIASTTTSTVTVNVGVSSATHSSRVQVFDKTITGDVSGVTGQYSPADCANVVSSVHTLVGIVTEAIDANTLPATRTISSFNTFEVVDYKIARQGYGFKPGDVFKPVGLVTHASLSSPQKEFELTVVDTFTDGFSAWQFGELDFIDSIKDLQDGKRTRFPLIYNGDLLSFESDDDIDLNAVLLIFIDGVIQDPGVHYNFEGGTSFILTAPPSAENNVSVFFYRGTRGIDSKFTNVDETIKVGDVVEIKQTENLAGQDPRTVSGISSSDVMSTNIYTGENIFDANDPQYAPPNPVPWRLMDWNKQKRDKTIEGEIISKARDSIEGMVYPTARIIGDFPIQSNGISTIFVDDAQFFNYEENESSINIVNVDAKIFENQVSVAASLSATVGTGGTISALTVISGGSGYVGSMVTVSIARPYGNTYTGTATTATALVPVVDGSLSGIASIGMLGGSGYDSTNPPLVIAPMPSFNVGESISGIATVKGFSGILTGIGTTAGINGAPLALEFHIASETILGLNNDLKAGYPIYIHGTNVGNGVTSINTVDASVVGIGTSRIDNIYIVDGYHPFGNPANSGIITCNIKSNTTMTDFGTANAAGFVATATTTTPDIGRFTWGLLQGSSRSSTVSIGVTGLTIDAGLSTFPTIQRRGFGLRDSGALRKDLG